MSRTVVTLRIAVDPAWDAGTRVQVYWDGGTGTVDYGTPLLKRPQSVFGAAVEGRALGVRNLFGGRFTSGRPTARESRTLGRGSLFGADGFSTPEMVEVPVEIPAMFGTARFGVRIIDPHGVEQSSAAAEIDVFVSAQDPGPLSRFEFVEHDEASDRVRFAIA